jgi:hypothetical protein
MGEDYDYWNNHWQNLSDEELVARLVQRDFGEVAAKHLVSKRDDPGFQETIGQALSE